MNRHILLTAVFSLTAGLVSSTAQPQMAGINPNFRQDRLSAVEQMPKSRPQAFMDDLSYYVENVDVFEEGQEEGRAWHIPQPSLSLNGKWKFFYADKPADVPSDFFKAGFSTKKWADIEVPSNWEMQGFGQALFRNVAQPFPARPPYIDMEYTPTGAYRRDFTIPQSWKGKEIFLRFEKVASASFVWVNGQQVGYNEGAQEPSEYDITKYVKPGKNTLSVMVLKYSDGVYLEDQDYWRLAGIFDDVWLYATGSTRIYDWYVVTDFDSTYTDSDLSVEVDVRSYDAASEGLVISAEVSRGGEIAASMSSPAVSDGRTVLKSRVKSPAKWSSETPSLYDLALVLTDASGKVIDRVDKKIGFKKTEIIDGVFYLNGRPLKVNAIDSHMQHPEKGHTMDEATIRKDFEILKQFNFNGVRTSHYPPVNKYLELADEYGLFIIDETGDEAHATEYLSNDPSWIPMYKERVRRLVLRDRNHPCVLFWSAGNESGEGPNIGEVINEGRSLDGTRYWMYGGNAPKHPAEDIIGPRYPLPIEHEMLYGMDETDKRPSFMDEYVSVAGNGGGGMDDFWREIYEHPGIIGGAVWDFVSPGLTEKVRMLEDKSPYGTLSVLMGRSRLVKGRTGNAVDLNKSDQWVQVYRADNLEISGNALTLVMDVMPRKFISSGGYLLTKGSNQFGLKQEGKDKLAFYIDTGRKVQILADLPSDWEGSWHRIFAVYDGSAMRLSIDGVVCAEGPATGRIRNLPLSVCIGRDEQALGQDTNVYICDALIDNVGIFAAAMPSEDACTAADAALWLDFETEADAGEYYSYGIGARTYGAIWPDRRVQPEMWQFKKSTQPLAFKLLNPDSGQVEVWNHNHFLPASYYSTVWTLTADEEVLQSGELELDVDALQKGVIRIPYTKPQIEPGREYRLNVSSVLKEDTLWAPEGFEVSWEQFELTGWNRPAEPVTTPSGSVRLAADGDALVASGEGFAYSFDARSGELRSMRIDGTEVLSQPLRLNVWRAPLANEEDGWDGAAVRPYQVRDGFGAIGHNSTIASMYYTAGLDHLGYIPMSVDAYETDGAVVVDVREIVLINYGESQSGQLDQYIFGRRCSGFEDMYRYTVYGDGTVKVHHYINPQGTLPLWLPRLGVTMSVNRAFSNVEWYGRGPQENYPDRKSGYRVGVYSTTADDMYEPYLIPQDYGLRTDTRWVRLTDDAGRGVEIGSDDKFNFNVHCFSTDNLTKAVYTYQLRTAEDLTVNIDYATSGVGDTSRGIYEGYKVHPEIYERTITLRPLRP